MKADQVTKALRQKFLDEGERLVFWRDGKGDFVFLEVVEGSVVKKQHASVQNVGLGLGFRRRS